eukprot:CAMPEP_0117635584 /NCGR_PEP_ID=MMETSP0802-20121206/6307_1 /TAXON_ID=38833 /ORGANISM="Micromonas sp., Strain CCMP2099" /LENGTH=61 /DNA_ID=CAMNT_0005440331 /DNA_START=234 /DNA_END=416 /DNA_ORIENTATION=+
MMPSSLEAAKTKPTKPAPITNPAISFAGGSARVTTKGRPLRGGNTRARGARTGVRGTRNAC